MFGVKLYAGLAALGWVGSVTSSVAQMVLGPATLLPLGVAVACLVTAVAFAAKVVRWVDRVEYRLTRLEELKTEEGP
jgi:branched-subunit amino acid permease